MSVLLSALLTVGVAAEMPAVPRTEGTDSTVQGTATSTLVDLNTADLTTLCTLPGIGPKKAEAILALRERRPFTRITQLLQVKGIGPRTLDRLRTRVTVGPAPSKVQAASPPPAATAALTRAQ